MKFLKPGSLSFSLAWKIILIQVTMVAMGLIGMVLMYGDSGAGYIDWKMSESIAKSIRVRDDALHVDWRALEIPDNLDVGRHDPAKLPGIVAGMNYADADVIVLSACVQMQSLPVVAKVEAQTGKPVLTAAIATTYAMLKALDLEPIVPGAGALLSGAY